MSVRFSWAVALTTVLALTGCTPAEQDVGPSTRPDELCSNGVDDNGDGKVDCADPTCFLKPACAPGAEDCTNGIDDNGDQLVDCLDTLCAQAAACLPGAERCADGEDNDEDGLVDCADADCASSPSCLAEKETVCDDGIDNDRDDAKDCADPDCAADASCQNTEVGKCANNIDDDGDGKKDCEDIDCAQSSCGSGCLCAANAKREIFCNDNVDNDGDGLKDCADPDCPTYGVEICDNGQDDTCDRAVDCGDAKCGSNAACQALADGAACTQNAQCAGGRCHTEASSGNPQGVCGNAVSCNPTNQTGCNGGMCVENGAFDLCVMRCTGTGLGATGRCRKGYVCVDLDTNATNDNNICMPLCGSDDDCATQGSNLGCNPFSRLCEQKDYGLKRYGAACSSDAECEGGWCFNKPGGYCSGPCAGNVKQCGTGGTCFFGVANGDNLGECYQACGAGAPCRGTPYTCQALSQGNICWCRAVGEGCSASSQCCSGKCDALTTKKCLE